ncbi:hypothetical protein BH11ACT8_BH11ACT8_04320 [soil metagenome]
MKMSAGNAGWHEVEADDLALPGRIYFRVQEVHGALRITELYIDGQGVPITAGGLRKFPIQVLEAWSDGDRLDIAGPDLSRLAAHFATTFGKAKHWVADSMRAQNPDSGVQQAPMPAKAPLSEAALATIALDPPPNGKLTDDFLRDVARAYDAAIAQRLSPAKTIAPLVNVSEKTVHSWVAKARDRGLMSKATRTGRIV